MFQPQPARILADAKRKFLTARSVTYDLTLDLKGAVGPVLFDAAPKLGSVGDLKASVKSSIDLSKYPYASTSTWSYEVSGVGDPHNGSWDGRSLKKDGLHYVQFEDDTLASQDQGTWYRSARPALSRLVTAPELGLDAPPLKPSAAAALRQALIDAPWLHFVSRLPDVSATGGPQYHFRVGLDADAMTAVLLKLKEAEQGPDDLRNSEADQVAATLAVAAWNDPVGDIFISKKDGYPRRLTFTATVSGTRGEVGVSFTADFSGYGQPVTVDVPESVEDLDQTSSASSTSQALPASGTRTPATGSSGAEIPTPAFDPDAAKLQQAVNALVNNFAPKKPAESGTNSQP